MKERVSFVTRCMLCVFVFGCSISFAQEIDIEPAPPLPPALEFEPVLSPLVGLVVAAQLPGGASCNELSPEQRQDLATGYCLNLIKIAKLDDNWSINTCEAICPEGRRRLLAAVPFILKINLARVVLSPEDVEAANKRVSELEKKTEGNLLEFVLEETLPKAKFLEQRTRFKYIEEDIGSGDFKPAIVTPDAPPPKAKTPAEECVDVPVPGGNSCLQHKGWNNCFDDWMIEGDFCAATCGRCELPPGKPIAVDNIGRIDQRRDRGTDNTDYPTDRVECDDLQASDGYTCETQKGLGRCDAEWFIVGAYCRRTCGRCKY